MKIHSNICDLKDKQKLQAWIYRIATNAIIDFYRKKSSIEKMELTEDLIKGAEDLVHGAEEDSSMNQEISVCLKPMINQSTRKVQTSNNAYGI